MCVCVLVHNLLINFFLFLLENKKTMLKRQSNNSLKPNGILLNEKLVENNTLMLPQSDDLKKQSAKKSAKKKGSKLKYLIDESNYIDTLHHKTIRVNIT